MTGLVLAISDITRSGPTGSSLPGPFVASLGSLAALVGAAALALAALAKLSDLHRTAQDLAALGVPLPGASARLLPPAELAIAAALLTRPTIGAVAAIGALLAFTGVLVAALRSGRRVSCGCLGPLSDRPISAATVARNIVLLAVVAAAGAAPDRAGPLPSLPTLPVALAAGSTALLAALAGQAAALHHSLGRIWSVELAGEHPSNPSTSITGRRPRRERNPIMNKPAP